MQVPGACGVKGEGAAVVALGAVGDTVRGTDEADAEHGVDVAGVGVRASGEMGCGAGPSTCWCRSLYSSVTVKGCTSMVSVAPP
jgi:hypothetical protein